MRAYHRGAADHPSPCGGRFSALSGAVFFAFPLCARSQPGVFDGLKRRA